MLYYLYMGLKPLFEGSVHIWNKVSQIYLGHGKYQLLLTHFGQMSINYQDMLI